MKIFNQMNKLPVLFSLILILNACNSDEKPVNSERKSNKAYDLKDFSRLAKLQQKLDEPLPGEWLYQFEEKGQAYKNYIQGKSVCPNDTLNKICILPLGDFSEMEKKLLQNTAEYVSTFFMMDVELLGELSDKVIPNENKRMNDYGIQLQTKFILDSVLVPDIPSNALCFIAISNKDLYPNDNWNFVFGQAYLKKRTGVSSFRRFYINELDSASYVKTLGRIIKTTTHELGHMFSIKHCRIYKCLMNGANSLPEADSKPYWLCPECLAKLQWCIKFDPLDRYDRLSDYFNELHFEKEKKFYIESKQIMEGNTN